MRDPDLENKIGSDEQKQKTLAFDLYKTYTPKIYKNIYIFHTQNTQNMIHTSMNSFTLFLSKVVIHIFYNLMTSQDYVVVLNDKK